MKIYFETQTKMLSQSKITGNAKLNPKWIRLDQDGSSGDQTPSLVSFLMIYNIQLQSCIRVQNTSSHDFNIHNNNYIYFLNGLKNVRTDFYASTTN